MRFKLQGRVATRVITVTPPTVSDMSSTKDSSHDSDSESKNECIHGPVMSGREERPGRPTESDDDTSSEESANETENDGSCRRVKCLKLKPSKRAINDEDMEKHDISDSGDGEEGLEDGNKGGEKFRQQIHDAWASMKLFVESRISTSISYTNHTTKSEDEPETDKRHQIGEKTEGKRPAKKAKVSTISKKTHPKPAKAARKPQPRHKKCLSMLPSVPLDILYEILSFLPLKDLISVLRTNKQFYETLSSPQAITVWKRARLRDGIPDPTPDFSELRWADLLFNPRCSSCDSRAHSIDFGLRRRMCGRCKKENLIPFPSFRVYYRQLDPEILDLVTFSYAGFFQEHNPKKTLYWMPEIDAVAKVWNTLKANAHQGKSGAEQKLEEFENSRFQVVRKANRNVSGYSEWYQGMLQERGNPRENRWKDIKRRFTEMGYQEIDIGRIYRRSEVDQKRELTERIWKRIQPVLEVEVQRAQHERLSNERTPLFVKPFGTYLDGLSPRSRITHPTLSHILKLEECRPLFDAKTTPEDATSMFVTDIIPRLPAMAEEWRQLRKDALRSALLAGSGNTDLQGDILSLAISVFVCDECSGFTSDLSLGYGSQKLPFFGWDGAIYHLGHNLRPFEVVFSATKTLITLSRGDPATETAKAMDEKDTWFSCHSCTPIPQASCNVYTWRQAVAHVLSRRHLARSINWHVLDDEERKLVVNKGNAEHSKSWVCNHCNANDGHLYGTQHTIESHLEEIHQILEPKPDVDLVLRPPERIKWPNLLFEPPALPSSSGSQLTAKKAEVRAQLSKSASYRCNDCRGSRCFDHQGVRSHLKAKHGKGWPRKDIDYMVV